MESSIKKYSREKGEVVHLRYLYKYLKPYYLPLIGVLVALTISSSSVLSIGLGLQYLIDEGLGKHNPRLLNTALLVMFTITIVLSLATYARYYLITSVGEKVVADIRCDVFKKLLRLSPGFYEVTKSGEVMSRLTTDTTVLQVVIGSSLSIMLRNILILVGGIALLIVTSPKLSAYIAIIVPLVVLFVLSLARRVRRLSRIAQDKIADLASNIGEAMDGIRTVQAYGREKLEYSNFSAHVNEALAAAIERVSLRARLSALVIMLAFGSVGVVLWVGGMDVLSGEITAGELSSFIFYSVITAGALGAISEVVGDIQRAAGATERIAELLYATPDITSPENPVKLSGEKKFGVHFKNVSFAYPSKPGVTALEDVSFSVEPGETIALVGPSGAGKSTILQLLLRFYDPKSGGVYLSDTNIKDLSLNDLRSHIALVSQEPVIFSGSAMENIRYGNEKASDEDVIKAAKAARVYNFMEKYPQGMDTYLGEKGVRLSGGERQRITIARAMLKNPQILLLDEATNALDAENEQIVQEALEKVMENRTTIVIAHRLSTVLDSDRIIVINQGRIETTGTHAELVKQGALYARLAELQFER